MGLRYEKALTLALPGAKHGQWFQFMDRNGLGHCQPDLIMAAKGELFVLEAKLTDCVGGRAQVRELYLPVVSLAVKRKVFGLVVARSVGAEEEKQLICRDLKSALALSARGLVPSLLWLGHGPLGFL